MFDNFVEMARVEREIEKRMEAATDQVVCLGTPVL